jgi:pimeloyl-ACP methyl ester carboxylesterase
MPTEGYGAEEVPERFAVNGVELAWGQWGHPGQSANGAEGDPPLVLCHGFTGSTIDFSLQIPALAERRRVVALDQRGHGRSTACGNVESYTLELLASDLHAFMEAVGGGEPVDLLGHSMGGAVSLVAALARPDLVRSLVLMDTSAWTFQFPDEAVRNMVQGFITKFDPARGTPPRPPWKSPEDELIEAATDEEWRARRDAVYLGMDAYAFKALGMTLAHGGTVDLRDQLPSITCPVTVVVGEHDHPLVDQAPELASLVTDGRLTVIPGAYHSPQLTHPDAWRAALEEHLTVAAASAQLHD